MKEQEDSYLQQMNRKKLRDARRHVTFFLSFFVVFSVFWCLKLTGITMAGEAFCGQDEHVHDEQCQKKELICEQHVHDETCISVRLVCPLYEVEHVHDETCMIQQLNCHQDEHIHDESCHQTSLVCTMDETEGHVHHEDCYEQIVICTVEDLDHVHEDACIQQHLICALQEVQEHHHDEQCYQDEMICGLENHVHSEDCYEQKINCTIETLDHRHDDACYEQRLICELDHPHDEQCTQLVMICEQEESHVHDESCYEFSYVCAYPEEEHTHLDECYMISECLLEEHIHVESCYSNINADLETEEDWEASLSNVERGGTTLMMTAAIAESQLDTAESTLNFEVDQQGVRRGITRYGQWYGHPYGDWSSMFVSFCLHYAGAEGFPYNAGPESMRLEWEASGLYLSGQDEVPETGYVVFLSSGMENEQSAVAAAIVSEVHDHEMTIIQGDYDNKVVKRTLDIHDSSILGYGFVLDSSPFSVMTMALSDASYLARTVNYSSSMFTSGRSFVLYTTVNGVHYAIDGNAQAVPVYIENGEILTDSADPDSLLWNFTRSGTRYVMANVGTGKYLHPYYNSATDYGIINATGWDTPLTASGTGVKIIHSASARLNASATAFEITLNQNEASVFQFGLAERCTVYLDGTNGNLMGLAGSDKDAVSVTAGSTITLPKEWKSPEKYSYTLKGWYDISNRKYYAAGETVKITENTLFYADWIASSYDIGRMNADVVDTVSTNDFITTRVFDYNSLFNTLSMNNNYTGSDSARWTLVDQGTVQTTGEETLNFVFIDYDDPGNPGAISYPIGRNQAQGVDYSRVTFDLYTPKLADLLFNTEVELPGKHYLGYGDHLFQYGNDPSDGEHYGYYYYDSMLNAASYHQSNGRFYVYDYLERTTDSAGNNSYSDFLPLNSPYANTNGKATGTYYYQGVHNEYNGVPHFSYDSKYSDNNNSPNRIVTNYWFGMSIDLDFYLPSVPGTVDSEGIRANQSMTGDDMVFEFSGDDDVWVLIDGKLVLDIGGIHGVETGSIDFSTGDVIVDGVKTGTVTDLAAGSHQLTMLYLERGSSMSNFKLRFNLSTRYAMTLRKEDTLTANMLNGAQFAFYTDLQCTQPAELYHSKADHERGASSTHIFTVENGSASLWGLVPGNTYYIEEIRGPDVYGGQCAKGIIRVRLNNKGLPDYEILKNAEGDLSVGYTAHGFKVNEDTQEAYIVITNTDADESEPTSVGVEKVWSDSADHSSDSITVYLMANGIQIQSVQLSKANSWKHVWVNLPKTDAQGNKVEYTVREATVPGYYGEVERIAAVGASSSTALAGSGFVNGKTYLLSTKHGYLGASEDKLLLESSEANAKNSAQTQWSAAVHNDGTVTLTNKVNQTLIYENYAFRASSSGSGISALSYANDKLYCFIQHSGWSETLYPIDNDSVASNITYNGVFYTTNNESEALSIIPQSLEDAQPPPSAEGSDSFRITNIPVGDAVISLTVKKQWDVGSTGDQSLYENLNVQMRLLSDGVDSGLIQTLNLRNGWTASFESLPKFNGDGKEIIYTVEEINLPAGWHVQYGSVHSVKGSQKEFETTVTNSYHAGVELPSTGGIGPYGHIILGFVIMMSSLVWYYGQRRKCERREC